VVVIGDAGDISNPTAATRCCNPGAVTQRVRLAGASYAEHWHDWNRSGKAEARKRHSEGGGEGGGRERDSPDAYGYVKWRAMGFFGITIRGGYEWCERLPSCEGRTASASLLEIVGITRWFSEAALVKSGCAGKNRTRTVRTSTSPNKASDTWSGGKKHG